MTALVVLVVAVVPTLALVALLGLVERAQRARSEVIARQVTVTDAIHRELGAIVAPSVTRRIRGPWQVRIAVPFDREEAVGSIVAIAHRTLSPSGQASPGSLRIVLVPQEAPVRRAARAQRLAAGEACTTPALPGARFTIHPQR